MTFYQFPQPHWQHLRTSNPVESPFATARLRTDAAKGFKLVKNATAVIWKMRIVAEQAFRRVKHPELMPLVSREIKFRTACRCKQRSPPDSIYTPIDKTSECLEGFSNRPRRHSTRGYLHPGEFEPQASYVERSVR